MTDKLILKEELQGIDSILYTNEFGCDYRKALPQIINFYREFFGQALPSNLDEIVLTPSTNDKGFDPTYQGVTFSGLYLCQDNKIQIVQDFHDFQYPQHSQDQMAQTLIHELGHRNYELETGLGRRIYKNTWMKFLPFLNRKFHRNYSETMFLHECVAYTIQHSFKISNNNSFDLSDEVFRELEHKTKDKLNFYERDFVNTSNYPFVKFSNYPSLSRIAKDASGIGSYLAFKYMNDNLWEKLKKITCIEDLRKLID